MIEYDIKINEGNDVLGMGKTITLKKSIKKTSEQFFMQSIYYKNRLIPQQVVEDVLDSWFAAAIEQLENGCSVSLKYKGNTMIRISPEVCIKGGNINLKRAKELDPTVTDITPENARRLVQKAGTYIKVKVRCDKHLTQKLQATDAYPDGSSTKIIQRKKVTAGKSPQKDKTKRKN